MKFRPATIKATVKDAEKRLINLGYKNFQFKGSSLSNGASFYFISEDGCEIRVSDHPLTGKRAFSTIQIDLFEIKKGFTPIAKEQNQFILTKEMIEAAAKRKLANK